MNLIKTCCCEQASSWQPQEHAVWTSMFRAEQTSSTLVSPRAEVTAVSYITRTLVTATPAAMHRLYCPPEV